MIKLNSKNSLSNNNLIDKCISKYTLIFLMLLSNFSNAQIFDSVQCRLKYEGLFNMNVIDDKLYNSGIYEMCGDTLNSIGVWNDSIWIGVDSGVISGNVYCFTKYKNEIYVGGSISLVGSDKIVVRGIAKIVNNKWDTVSYGIGFNTTQDKITSLIVYQNELYAAGKFTEIDGIPAQNIAKWDGEKWTVIPGLQSSFTQVNCMAVYKGELYVGGHFWTAGGKPANFIARWNGNQWNTVGNGLNHYPLSMIVDSVHNQLYVSGLFDATSSTIRGRILRWDGTNWHSVGKGNFINSTGIVNTIEFYNGYLYAGLAAKTFTNIDTVLARWDGQSWEKIGDFTEGNIINLKYYKDKLYLGGNFKTINNDTIPYLASYYSTDSVIVGINPQKKSTNNHIKIFPNPTKDIIRIESEIPIKHYEITDINGRVVQEGEMNNKSIIINQLNKAIYLIHFFDEDQRNIGTEKFVLE